ncbi:MAG TPA: hypothetical protein VEB21_15365 [Terriglobales bacterium]|nr:hypothetical protein [Terriglobales bacterium]
MAVLCSRCILDDSLPGVRLDAAGICNHCRIHDGLAALYPAGEVGRRDLEAIAARIRADGAGKRYDCVVGVSGGRDTSYCLHMTKELGLRPLAVHFDNGWDATVAKDNLRKLCTKLAVDLHTVIMDWEESRELTNITIRAGIPYIDTTDDVGIARALYDAAVAEKVRYIILSHSFREEGIKPLLWSYFDGRFVRAMIRRFGQRPLRQFKNVDIPDLIYWHFVKRIKIINLTNYYDDAGPHVEELLSSRYGWVDTQQHHFDNEMFAMVSSYMREKFGANIYLFDWAARVRTGVVRRDQALARSRELPSFATPENLAYCLKKQGITPDEWQRILAGPRRYFTDYPNYYGLLRLMKYPIRWLGRRNILPAYIYDKYFET